MDPGPLQTLEDWARKRGGEAPHDPPGQLWRIGFDEAGEFCLNDNGQIFLIFCEWNVPRQFVASSLDAFNASLNAFESVRPLLSDLGSGPSAATVVRELTERLQEIDPTAFSNEDHWWSRVAQGLDHLTRISSGAAFQYLGDDGELRLETGFAVPGWAHAERAVWAKLSAEGVLPEQVEAIHTELQPCFLPGGYCSPWLDARFPQAQITYNFEYPEGAAERESAIIALQEAAASGEGERDSDNSAG